MVKPTEGAFLVDCNFPPNITSFNDSSFVILQNSPCDPCMVHCCMHWCALCQEHREMQGRLSDNAVMPMTVINPPVPQEMHDREAATVDHKEDAEIQMS